MHAGRAWTAATGLSQSSATGCRGSGADSPSRSRRLRRVGELRRRTGGCIYLGEQFSGIISMSAANSLAARLSR